MRPASELRPGYITPILGSPKALVLQCLVAESSHGTTHLLDTLNTSLPPATADKLEAVRQLAHEAGVSLYLVGGAVRDLLLGLGIRDLDLVTEGDAPRLAAVIAEKQEGRLVSHSPFGTATVELDDLRLDLSTARRETYPRPGALPQVAPSNMDDDLRRRDFSMNAVALQLVGPAEGSLLDPCCGQSDIQQRKVHILHSASFIDDPTRMLRAVRYEQRLGFCMDSETLRLLQEALAHNALSTLSGDRLRHELELILNEDHPVPALHRAEELGLLGAVHPGLNAGSLGALDGSGPHPPLVYLAALAYPLSPPEADAFASRLNMPSEWASVVRDASAFNLIEYDLATEPLPPSEVVQMLNGRHLCALEAARSICAHTQTAERIRRYLSEWRHTSPSLKGGDLAGLGVAPGPETGRILRELGRARLDGLVSCREDEIALVERLLELSAPELSAPEQGVAKQRVSEQGVMEGASGTA